MTGRFIVTIEGNGEDTCFSGMIPAAGQAYRLFAAAERNRRSIAGENEKGEALWQF